MNKIYSILYSIIILDKISEFYAQRNKKRM